MLFWLCYFKQRLKPCDSCLYFVKLEGIFDFIQQHFTENKEFYIKDHARKIKQF